MELQVPVISSKNFTHCPKSKGLVIEISDIGGRLPVSPLYDDACDVGFALRNEKTGNVTRWHLADTVVNKEEDEVLGWYFLPCSESIRKNPQLAGYSVRIIND